MKDRIVFDIMVGDRFYCTERLPISLDMIVDYHDDMPVIDHDRLMEIVLRRHPTLKYDKWHMEFPNRDTA